LLDPEFPTGRGRSVDELLFNQQGDGFRIAIEFEVPQEVRRKALEHSPKTPFEFALYEVGFGKQTNGVLDVTDETLMLISDRYSDRGEANALVRQRQESLTHSYPPDVLETFAGRDTRRPRFVVVSARGSGPREYTTERPGAPSRRRWGGSQRSSALATLPDEPDYFTVSTWVRDLFLTGVRPVALNSAAMRRPVSPSLARVFVPDGSNLPHIVRSLGRKRVTSDWLAHVQTVLPELEKVLVRTRPEDRHSYLALKYASDPHPVPSWLLSDGTLRLLGLTVLPYLPDMWPLYLIEEPENGLHPGALESVFDSLRSVYDGQVLVATHSPLLLGQAELDHILCFIRRDDGSVEIVRGDSHPALRHWRGEVPLSTLFAGGVLG
jgi:hypothetical protein